MKLCRLTDLLITFVSFPVCLIAGTFGGMVLSVVLWWSRLKLDWSMRNSSYVWETTDSKPISQLRQAKP
jgi:hypothetical protein